MGMVPWPCFRLRLYNHVECNMQVTRNDGDCVKPRPPRRGDNTICEGTCIDSGRLVNQIIVRLQDYLVFIQYNS